MIALSPSDNPKGKKKKKKTQKSRWSAEIISFPFPMAIIPLGLATFSNCSADHKRRETLLILWGQGEAKKTHQNHGVETQVSYLQRVCEHTNIFGATVNAMFALDTPLRRDGVDMANLRCTDWEYRTMTLSGNRKSTFENTSENVLLNFICEPLVSVNPHGSPPWKHSYFHS